MENIVLLLLGIAISSIGIVNIKGNINTVHAYNRRRVRDEDIPRYARTIGTGTLIMGLSIVLAFIVSLWNEEWMTYVVAPGLVIGLLIILYGQFKYNHGIF